MSEYKISGETQSALIRAAGTLFAERGVAAVSVREITKLAGTQLNAVSYHFGGKDGLTAAVLEFVFRDWEPELLVDYVRSNEHLFQSPDGQKRLVLDLLEILFRFIYSQDQEAWINMFRIAGWRLDDDWVRRFEPVREVFMTVFRRITGNDDFTTAHCWFLNIIGGASFYAANLSLLSKVAPDEKLNFSFYRRIQHIAMQNALFGLGLITHTV